MTQVQNIRHVDGKKFDGVILNGPVEPHQSCRRGRKKRHSKIDENRSRMRCGTLPLGTRLQCVDEYYDERRLVHWIVTSGPLAVISERNA